MGHDYDRRTAKTKLRWKKPQETSQRVTFVPIEHDYWLYGQKKQHGESGARKAVWFWDITINPVKGKVQRLKEHLPGSATDAKAWAQSHSDKQR